MLYLPGHGDLIDPLIFEDFDQPAQLAQRNPVTARRQRFDFARSFFFNTDGHHFMAQLARILQRQNRKPAVTRDQTVAHHLTKPRSDASMNASSSSRSGVGSISARIRSTACEVFRPA